MTSLFDSLDYRHFLKQHFDNIRKEKYWFSYRMIAQKLKIDAGQLVKILQGQRHISERLIPVFSTFLGLKKREQEYFTCLVRFNKAKTGSETKLYFEKLMEIKDLILPHVDPNQDKFYQKWYHSVIRILLAFYKFDGNFKKLGNLLCPAISEREAKASVELLIDLGFIEKGSDGDFNISERFITGGGNWRMLAVRHFQQQTIQLSERSLLNDPPNMRDISSLTISIPEETLGEIREMLAEFRKTVLRRVMEITQEPDTVYQLNLQLIPVASVPKKADSGEERA
ncbi:MAG: TIGR02147 family protein [Chitinispirillaceae bacterium]|nr:TIGR02147 family protein [Chitinispirillaceae bacterium]